MKLPRRQFLLLVTSAVALSAALQSAKAQAYPTRPVRLVVGFPPGGGTDMVARTIGQSLSERLGQPFVVENRPGAGSNLAAQGVINSPPDGYTLLSVTGSNAVNATFYDTLPFNFLRDIEPVAGIVKYPLILITNPMLPVRTMAEFMSYARTNPAKVAMASFGAGTSSHLAWELLRMMTGLHLVHVPYRGEAPALTDVIGGQVQAMLCSPLGSLPYIRSGKVRALAVTSAARWDGLPDLAPIADVVPGYEASSWQGIGAPRGTPREIVATLNREINKALADPAIKARFDEWGTTPMSVTPEEFRAFLSAETEKWGRVVRASGVKPE